MVSLLGQSMQRSSSSFAVVLMYLNRRMIRTRTQSDKLCPIVCIVVRPPRDRCSDRAWPFSDDARSPEITTLSTMFIRFMCRLLPLDYSLSLTLHSSVRTFLVSPDLESADVSLHSGCIGITTFTWFHIRKISFGGGMLSDFSMSAVVIMWWC